MGLHLTGSSLTTLNNAYGRRWQATTAYTAGDVVINPSGDLVSAKATFTSGASYDARKWTLLHSKRPRLLDTVTAPYLAGHRGGGLLMWPEESMEGVRDAVKNGFVPDVDVQLLSDGVTLVCCHDFTVDRTMTGTGNVNTFDKNGWRNMLIYPAVPGGPRARPLEWSKLMDEFGGKTIISVEPKTTAGITSPTTALINDIVARGLQRSVLLQSFVYADCQAAAAAGIVAGFISNTADPATLVADGVEFCVLSTAVTDAQITALRAAGIRIQLYQVDTSTAYASYVGKGVEMILSGDPGQAGTMRPRSDRDPFDQKVPWPGWSITSGGSSNFRFNRRDEFGMGVEGGAGLSGSMVHKWAGKRAARARIRWRIRYAITSTTDLTRWGPSMYLGRQPAEDTAYSDASATGANGYHAFIRRNGTMYLYRVDNGVGTLLNSMTTPSNIAANTAEGTVDCELLITATNVTLTNVTSGVSITAADTTYRYTDWVPGSVWNASNAFISNVSVEDLP